MLQDLHGEEEDEDHTGGAGDKLTHEHRRRKRKVHHSIQLSDHLLDAAHEGADDSEICQHEMEENIHVVSAQISLCRFLAAVSNDSCDSAPFATIIEEPMQARSCSNPMSVYT